MVGERQRDKTWSDQPAFDPAKYHAVFQSLSWPARREHYWLVSVRSQQGFQPLRRMKNGSARVLFKKFCPSRISKRINLFKQWRNGCTPGDLTRADVRTTLRCDHQFLRQSSRQSKPPVADWIERNLPAVSPSTSDVRILCFIDLTPPYEPQGVHIRSTHMLRNSKTIDAFYVLNLR